jgi:hypothetical protein
MRADATMPPTTSISSEVILKYLTSRATAYAPTPK